MKEGVLLNSEHPVQTAIGSTRPLKVAVIGLRGIPDVQGGVESHVQELYQRMAEAGFDVTVHGRAPFVQAGTPAVWRRIKLVTSWSPRRPGLEALTHTFVALLRAWRDGADVLHIHGIGPAVLTPLARLLGMPVVVTHHSRNYEHDKWGRFAKWLLRTGELFAARFATKVICVAKNDADRLNRRFGEGTAIAIPNGVPMLVRADAPGLLDEFGLAPGRYILNVARIVPEKRQQDLIRAFRAAAPKGWKLALVGSPMHASSYADEITRLAEETPNCVMLGGRRDGELATLYANAGFYVLPSAHEGLPITLLEALSFGLRCLASDIPASREINLGEADYFPVGAIDALAHGLTRLACEIETGPAKVPGKQLISRLPDEYSWDIVSRRTGDLMREIGSR